MNRKSSNISLPRKPIASFPESRLCFQNRSFFSKLLFQFKFEALFSELRLSFQNRSFVSWIEASFPESKLTFQLIRSFVFSFLLQLKFAVFFSRTDASFAELKFLFRNPVLNYWNQALNLSCNEKLEAKLQV